MNKYIKKVYPIFLLAACILAACESSSLPASNPGSSLSQSTSVVDDNYINDGELSIHTDHQAAFIASAAFNLKYNSNIANGTKDWSRPKLLTIKVPQGTLDAQYTVRFSDDEKFSTYTEYVLSSNYFQVTNLKINTKYYWYSYATKDGQTDTSKTHVFKTKDEAPRNLNIDGVENSRDNGGWKIEGTTKRIKQGLLFRTGKLHDRYNTYPSEEGLKTITDTLGIKTEIDLRSADEAYNLSTVIPNGKYFNLPMNYNNGFFANEANLKATRQVFELLASKKNYPIMYHCAIGTDRTGWIAFLVNGLLGVSTDDLYRDYLFSNFGNIGDGRTKTDITTYINTFATKYPSKATLSEQIEAFLIENGVTQAKLDLVKSILIEK